MTRFLAVLWVSALLLSCQSAETRSVPATAIVLRVEAEQVVREAGMTLSVRTAREERRGWRARPPVSVPFAKLVAWPVDLPIVPERDSGLGEAVELVVSALDSEGVRIAQARVITSFVAREQRLLELLLQRCGDSAVCERDDACHGTHCRTCVAGECVPTTAIPGAALQTLDPASATPSREQDAGEGELDATAPLADSAVDLEDGEPEVDPAMLDAEVASSATQDASGEAEDGADASDATAGSFVAAEASTSDAEAGIGDGAIGDVADASDGSGSPCDGAAPRCIDNAVQRCEDGRWSAPEPCVESACMQGGCGGSCAPTARRCAGLFAATAEVCQANGQWGIDRGQGEDGVCPLTCVDGACSAACTGAGSYRCSALHPSQPLVCTNEQLTPEPVCTQRCRPDAGCVTSPSCTQTSLCGAGLSCCAAPLVPGGQFRRSYDGVEFSDDGYPATISPFHLDRFEVTVGRFRRFVTSYDQPGSRPAPGAGKTRSADDPGWLPAWTDELPATAAELRTMITTCDDASYTELTGASDRLPMNCVNWYVAFAFCIWDGGRLPTEAEWNFAASGGAEQRAYPWVRSGDPVQRDLTFAGYNEAPRMEVGSYRSGEGRWGHADLIGNVEEWMRDAYDSPYPTTTCVDCVNLREDGSAVLRGGAAQLFEDRANPNARWLEGRRAQSAEGGFRCVKSL